MLGFYAVYEASRGLVAGSRAQAVHRARDVAALERALHVFAEPRVQEVSRHVPGLLDALGVAYLTLHLLVTSALLLWLYIRRPHAFASVRSTLIVASSISLAGFVLFPTAPPRAAGVGLADSISNGEIDLNHGLVDSLYNPYAAVPSMHLGYALIVGAVLVRHCRGVVRLVGVAYPAFVLFVIVATGNHFFFDAAAGALVASASAVVVMLLRPSQGAVVELRPRLPANGRVERAA